MSWALLGLGFEADHQGALEVTRSGSVKPFGWLMLTQCPIKSLRAGISRILAGTSIMVSLASGMQLY